MTISLSEFLAQLAANPVLAVTVALTLGVVLVNGWTDAPNAIATCVSTRAMSARSAILMAAVFNFLGVLVMTMVNASVAATIYNMVDFGGDTHEALIALCAALFSIVVYSVVASMFDGIFQGIGYTWVLLAMCIIREFLGAGTFGGGILGPDLKGIQIIPSQFPAGMLTLPVGGFLVLACLIAAMQWALSRSKNKEESK